jgi:hypothetical protein
MLYVDCLINEYTVHYTSTGKYGEKTKWNTIKMTNSYATWMYKCLNVECLYVEDQVYLTAHFRYAFIFRILIFQLKETEAHDSLCSLRTTWPSTSLGSTRPPPWSLHFMGSGRLERCPGLLAHNSCARLEPRFVFVTATVGVVYLKQMHIASWCECDGLLNFSFCPN